MKYSFLLLLSICVFACSETDAEKAERIKAERKATVNALKDEVIEIHDEVMPKTSDINRVKRKLKKILKEEVSDSTIKIQILDQIEQLGMAEDTMLNWMKEYKHLNKFDPFEAKMKYYNNEKVRIINVRDFMLKSLENGESLLNNLSN